MSSVDDALDRLEVRVRYAPGTPHDAADFATVRDALERHRDTAIEWIATADDRRHALEAAEAEVERLTLVAENRYERIGKLEAEVRRLTEGLRGLKDIEYSEIDGHKMTRIVSYRALNERIDALLADSPPDPS